MPRWMPILFTLSMVGHGVAHAGRNAGGALIVHTNDARNYTVNICSRFEIVDSPGSCGAAGTRTDKTDAPSLIWLIASFPLQSDPGVTRVDFGLSHNLPVDQGYFHTFGPCGPPGSIQSPDAGWPDVGGNTLVFGSPVAHDLFFPIYFLNVYGYQGVFVGPSVHPLFLEALFFDDGTPPVLDACDRFGQVRWYEPGYNVCPDGAFSEACCFPDGHCALFPDGATCMESGGTPYGGVPCDPSPCRAAVGGCCYEDGQCSETTSLDCLSTQGSFQGYGVPCDPNPCPQPSACCYETGECRETSSADCLASLGTFQGYGVPCEPNPCPQPGACCLPGGSCTFALETSCLAEAGDWRAGVPCDLAGCPPAGACCFDTTPCRLLTTAECEARGGSSQGEGTLCEPFTCPARACCFENGSCATFTEPECTSRGGVSLGDVLCDPNPCIGACCFFNGSCEVTTIATCLASNAEYLGHAYVCEPNPCETAGVPDAASQPRTWGQIKAGYR